MLKIFSHVRLLNDTEIAKAQRDFELKKAAYDVEVRTKVCNGCFIDEPGIFKIKIKFFPTSGRWFWIFVNHALIFHFLLHFLEKIENLSEWSLIVKKYSNFTFTQISLLPFFFGGLSKFRNFTSSLSFFCSYYVRKWNWRYIF